MDFNHFWSIYPRREAKKHAEKAYYKALREVSHEKIIQGVEAYRDHVATKDRQYIKLPATWLNGGCWDDEYEPERKRGWAAAGDAVAEQYLKKLDS